MPAPRIAVEPDKYDFAIEAVLAGGGAVVEVNDAPDALVWLGSDDYSALAEHLADRPEIRWVQLPMAGVERVAELGLFDDGRLWTCAKGAYAESVAEHVLTLALAGLRNLPERVSASSWGEPAGTTLYEQSITILGAGGITSALLQLLAPFRVKATVVRRRPEPIPGASRTVPITELHEVLPGALLVVLALALTPETVGVIGATELALMDESAWLINVARGRHVNTEALADALEGRSIAGAALDVTEPEPLPGGHRLWGIRNCIITPHTADTWPMVLPNLAERICTNVALFAAGKPLVGAVDPEAGY